MRALVITLAFFALAAPVFGSPSLVQQAMGGVTTGNPVVTISTPTAGNSLIALIAHSNAKTVSSLSGGGVTWVQGPFVATTSAAVDIWYGHVSSGSGTTVTATMAGGGTTRSVIGVSEWSNLNNAAPEAVHTNSALADPSPNTGAALPVSANNLVIAIGAWTASDYSSGPTNGFTRMTQGGAATIFVEGAYLIQSSATSQSTGWSLTASINWSAAIAAFGAPSAAGNPRHGDFFLPEEDDYEEDDYEEGGCVVLALLVHSRWVGFPFSGEASR